MMYVTSLFQVLPHGVTMEAVQEVEALPSTRVTQEESYTIQTQQRYSQQVWPTNTHTLKHTLVELLHMYTGPCLASSTSSLTCLLWDVVTLH